MTVKEFAEQFQYRPLCMPDADRAIKGGYVGDLLSWVMGRLPSDFAWVTIMSNVNIIAVAALTDPACIILSESVTPDPDTLARAQQQGINLLATSEDSFSVCAKLQSVL